MKRMGLSVNYRKVRAKTPGSRGPTVAASADHSRFANGGVGGRHPWGGGGHLFLGLPSFPLPPLPLPPPPVHQCPVSVVVTPAPATSALSSSSRFMPRERGNRGRSVCRGGDPRLRPPTRPCTIPAAPPRCFMSPQTWPPATCLTTRAAVDGTGVEAEVGVVGGREPPVGPVPRVASPSADSLTQESCPARGGNTDCLEADIGRRRRS